MRRTCRAGILKLLVAALGWGESTTLAEFGPKSATWRVTMQAKDGESVFSLRRFFLGKDGITRPIPDTGSSRPGRLLRALGFFVFRLRALQI